MSKKINKLKEKYEIKDAETKLIIDGPGEGLESTYYWLTTQLENLKYEVKKTDEAMLSTVSSSFFADMGSRKTMMEKKVKEIMGDINNVTRSILNLIYDLKEFDRRLEIFEDIRDGNKEEKEAAEIAIKSVWMDEIDSKRGMGSINQLTSSGKLEFVTLRDAFLQAKDVGSVSKMDLNERVKRIVKARVEEYLKWRKKYEKDLRTRRKIEKSYLKAQVHSLEEYTKWAKPYLMAVQELRMSEKIMGKYKSEDPDLVKFFDTGTFTVSIRAKKKIKASSYFKNLQMGRNAKYDGKRIKEPSDKVLSVIELNFIFGSKPAIIGQGGPGSKMYRHVGKIIVVFKGYVMTESELEEIEEIEKDETEKLVNHVKEMTTGSLEAVKEDLDNYLNEKDDEKSKKNKIEIFEPFNAALKGFNELFGPLFKLPLPNKKSKSLSRRDKWVIKILKEEAKDKVMNDIYKTFKIYRKAHGHITFRG